jgi:superfamily II DNA/RNA helicase
MLLIYILLLMLMLLIYIIIIDSKVSRRNVLCSATLNHDIRRLAKLSLENPEECFADVHETLKGFLARKKTLSVLL